MLWLVEKDSSHEIISCNIHKKDELHQLWVTRPNGKSLLIRENENEKEIKLLKEAIDYAIETGEKALRLD
jgi:hypothetical protein